MGDRLAGRVALVTGAAQGIGQTYCEGLAREGARVVAADIQDCSTTVRKVQELGGEALGVTVDVTRAESVAAMVAQTLQAFGKIDVLVNNAAIYGGLRYRPFTDIDEAEWDKVMTVNVKGVWLVTKAVVPTMQAQGYGKIINIASAVIFRGLPALAHYIASKGAVFALSRDFSRELGPMGIRVNSIAPGLTMSEASRDILVGSGAQGRETEVARQTPLGRLLVPEDLVGTVLFLASPDSDMITGQCITVDGGIVNW